MKKTGRTEQAGEVEKAKEVKEALNTKGARAAERLATGGKPKAPAPARSFSARRLTCGAIALAHDAINSLSRISQTDPLRKRGFQIVTDWVRRHRGKVAEGAEATKVAQASPDKYPPGVILQGLCDAWAECSEADRKKFVEGIGLTYKGGKATEGA